MPTYTYKREDGSRFEVEQKITDDPLTVCPTTEQPVKRIIVGGQSIMYNTDGFYNTDYNNKNSS